ncbi:MAG: nucleotide exchange factor GrpE [Jatrophihabitans sp.]|uniref:nucleotide exchange factor GrpE n=1 Tax=Jatrophihabitans sp. TaxID=1932789 RepID=UPI003F80DDED
MRIRPATEGDLADQVARLGEEVTQLRDLFSRRLLDDRAKTRMLDALQEQLDQANGALARELLAPLAAELLLVVDRIDAMDAAGDDLASVRTELLEILERRGVRPIEPHERFDPALDEVAETVAADGANPAGAIVRTVRAGYRLEGRLVRPARVVVAADGAAS